MCGIVAVVRQPRRARRARAGSCSWPRSTRPSALAAAVRRPRPTRRGRTSRAARLPTVDAGAARARDGVGRAARRSGRAAPRSSTAPTSLHERRRRSIEAAPRRQSRLDGAEIEALQRGARSRARTRCGRSAATGSRTARAVEDLVGGAPSGRAALDAFHSIQVALSALDRLEVRGRDSAGLHVLVTGHGLDLDDPTIARLHRARVATIRCSPSGAVRSRRRAPRVRLQDRGRDRRARRQHRAPARADPRRRAAAPRAARRRRAKPSVLAHTRWASVGIISEANAHPLNQEELGGDRDGAVRGRRAQRRRRQLRRPQGARRPALPGRDHHRRQGHPRARRRGASRRGADLDRGVPRDGRVVRGFGRDRRAVGGRARPRAARAAGQRAGALRRARRRRVRRRERAVRRRRGVRPLPAPRRRDDARARRTRRRQGQVVVLDRAERARSTASRRLSYDGRELPVDDARAAATRDHDARRRPRRRAALPAQGDLRSARVVPQDVARPRSSSDDGRLDVRLAARDAARRAVVDRLRSRAAIRRVLVIGQGTAAIAGQSLARALRGAYRPAGPIAVEAVAATELSGFGLARRHARHARRRDLAVGHDRPTRTAPSTSSRARGARRHRDRQPPPERPRRQERRRALHLRRPRRRDERRVDEGVLRAGRGRLPARVRELARASSAPTTDAEPRTYRARAARRRCASCPTAMREVLERRAGDRASPRSATR